MHISRVSIYIVFFLSRIFPRLFYNNKITQIIFNCTEAWNRQFYCYYLLVEVIIRRDNALLRRDNALIRRDNALIRRDNALIRRENALIKA